MKGINNEKLNFAMENIVFVSNAPRFRFTLIVCVFGPFESRKSMKFSYFLSKMSCAGVFLLITL